MEKGFLHCRGIQGQVWGGGSRGRWDQVGVGESRPGKEVGKGNWHLVRGSGSEGHKREESGPGLGQGELAPGWGRGGVRDRSGVGKLGPEVEKLESGPGQEAGFRKMSEVMGYLETLGVCWARVEDSWAQGNNWRDEIEPT